MPAPLPKKYDNPDEEELLAVEYLYSLSSEAESRKQLVNRIEDEVFADEPAQTSPNSDNTQNNLDNPGDAENGKKDNRPEADENDEDDEDTFDSRPESEAEENDEDDEDTFEIQIRHEHIVFSESEQAAEPQDACAAPGFENIEFLDFKDFKKKVIESFKD